MDPYLILGVPRGCTREEVKGAFRSRVHLAHPDRGGDAVAFVQLCNAYRQILEESPRADEPIDARPGRAARSSCPDGATAARPTPRENYVSWLRQVSPDTFSLSTSVLVERSTPNLGAGNPPRHHRVLGTPDRRPYLVIRARVGIPPPRSLAEPLKEALLSEQRGQRVAAIDPHRAADGIADLGRRVDAEGMQDRGADVVGADGVARRVGGPAVGGAVDGPAADARTGQDGAIAVRPVLAAGVGPR